jgi:hypothetical protein
VAKPLSAALVVTVGIAGVLVVGPIVAAPVLLIGGLAWRTGPRWARMALAATGTLCVLYFLLTQPWG